MDTQATPKMTQTPRVQVVSPLQTKIYFKDADEHSPTLKLNSFTTKSNDELTQEQTPI